MQNVDAILFDVNNQLRLFVTMSSFFGSPNRGSAPTGQLDQARLSEAAMELEAVSDLFNRIVNSCHAKCISTRYAEPELNKGEAVCVDRSALSLPPRSHSHAVHSPKFLFFSFNKSLFSRRLRVELTQVGPLNDNRCVAKYFAINEKVQDRLQNAQKAGGGMGGM